MTTAADHDGLSARRIWMTKFVSPGISGVLNRRHRWCPIALSAWRSANFRIGQSKCSSFPLH